MSNRLLKLINTKYPQNYILRNPIPGGLFVGVFCFAFTVLYHPNFTHAKPLSHTATMAIYCFSIALLLMPLIKLLKRIPFFSAKQEWTFLKEILIEAILVFVMGVYVFLLGYLVEYPSDRSNLDSFLDSVGNTFLIGVLPYLFFSVQSYKHLLPGPIQEKNKDRLIKKTGELKIEINSKLKKDNLSFLPHEFLYAESNGNYVSFYLNRNDKICKKTIRNSISNVEVQLSDIEYFVRTHRAFIVNVRKVSKKHGNASGYRLTLQGAAVEIPVSRLNIANFDDLFQQNCL